MWCWAFRWLWWWHSKVYSCNYIVSSTKRESIGLCSTTKYLFSLLCLRKARTLSQLSKDRSTARCWQPDQSVTLQSMRYLWCSIAVGGWALMGWMIGYGCEICGACRRGRRWWGRVSSGWYFYRWAGSWWRWLGLILWIVLWGCARRSLLFCWFLPSLLVHQPRFFFSG